MSDIRYMPSWLGVFAACATGNMSAALAASETAENFTHGATRSVEEIVVHARKRDQMLRDTPVSISVVGQDTINDWTITFLEELQVSVPNLKTYAQFAYYNSLSLRGVGTFSRNIGFDERVGLYQDGIYLGPSYGLNQNLLDVAQVEVLRGPQGTFFGRNSIACAATLISDKPGETFEGRALVRIGNRGSRILQARLAGPIADGLSASVAAGVEKRHGLTTNLFNGERLDNRDRFNVRAQLVYRTDNFEAHLSFDRNELDERMLIGDPNSDSFGIAPDTNASNPFEVNFNVSPKQKVVTEGAGLTLDWTSRGGMKLTSLSGLRSSDASQTYDTDYSPADIFRVNYAENYSHFSQEVRLTSPDDSTIGYLLGITYLDQKGETDRHAIGGDFAALIGIEPGGDMTSIGRVDTTAWGLYGNLDISLSDALTLSAGLRWSRDEKAVDWTVDTLKAPFFFLASGTLEDKRHDTDLSPTISLTYKASDTLTAFVRYGEGFKSGGYNLDYVSQAIFPDQLEFRKEKARSFEGGIKGSHMGGRAHYSATVFWVDYSDYQVNQFLDLGGGSTVILISNAAKVRTKGLELEWAGRLTDSFDATATLAVLDAKYRQFESGGVGGTDVSGNALDAPNVEASIVMAYHAPLSGRMGLYATAAYSYADGFHVTPDNIKEQPLLGGGAVPYGYLSARHQLGLKAGLESADGWRIGAFVHNALDRDGTTSSLRDFFGTIVEARTVPRIFGAELAYRF